MNYVAVPAFLCMSTRPSVPQFCVPLAPPRAPGTVHLAMSVPDANLYEQLKAGILKIYEHSTTNEERQSIGQVRTGPASVPRPVTHAIVAT